MLVECHTEIELGYGKQYHLKFTFIVNKVRLEAKCQHGHNFSNSDKVEKRSQQ